MVEDLDAPTLAGRAPEGVDHLRIFRRIAGGADGELDAATVGEPERFFGYGVAELGNGRGEMATVDRLSRGEGAEYVQRRQRLVLIQRQANRGASQLVACVFTLEIEARLPQRLEPSPERTLIPLQPLVPQSIENLSLRHGLLCKKTQEDQGSSRRLHPLPHRSPFRKPPLQAITNPTYRRHLFLR